MNENYNNDELMHYGVLGMKWGVRRAYKKGKDYNYRSMGQKKYDKKVAKLEKKAAKIEGKGERSSFNQNRKLENAREKRDMFAQRDRNRVDYAKNSSVGKSIAKTLMFGPLGAGNYNRFRSSGHGRIVSALGSNYISASLGYPLTLAISKNAENKTARDQIRARK